MAQVDWSLCVICQDIRSFRELRCPRNARGMTPEGVKETYSSFLAILAELRDLNLPLGSECKLPDSITADTMYDNFAKWHRTCKLQYTESKLRKQIDEAKRKREADKDPCADPSPSRTRQCHKFDKTKCVFCQQDTSESLHNVTLIEFGKALLEMATQLQDSVLTVRFGTGDLVALETKYHLACMTKFRTRHRSWQRSQVVQRDDEQGINTERVITEIVESMKEQESEGKKIFPLAKLVRQAQEKRGNLNLSKNLNATRFKERILEEFKGDVIEHGTGYDRKNLIFEEGFNSIIKDALKQRDYADDVRLIGKVAKMIREDMSLHDGFVFDGKFNESCQSQSVPSSLKTLISLILNGPSMEGTDSQQSLSICQLLYTNSRKKPSQGTTSRHLVRKETPMPLYVGLMLHSETRSRKLLDKLHALGLSASYNRVISLERQIASSLCQRFRNDDAVVPVNMKKNTFTVAAIDNIDFNASSTTATASFHGTSISYHQEPDDHSVDSDPFKLMEQSYANNLPTSFTSMKSIDVNVSKAQAPVQVVYQPHFDGESELQKEENWSRHSQAMMNLPFEDHRKLSFVAYHTQKAESGSDTPWNIGLTPMFDEKAATAAMMRHGMSVISHTIKKLNPDQIPVICGDQPLFALMKQIQWQFPETFGEDKIVITLGGLHLEMALWTAMGKMLSNSGWNTLLAEADVTTAGIAESLLHASHLKRTRLAHEISLVVFSKLKSEAYDSTDKSVSEQDWEQEMNLKSPTFFYWNMILSLQKKIFTMIRSFREHKIDLYIFMLDKLAFLFFALDSVNYARWVPVHLRDMKNLPLSVKREFDKGRFTVNRSGRRFSSIPIDQSHEMTNKDIKDAGGLVGIFTNYDARTQWLISAPKVSEILLEFESTLEGFAPIRNEYEHHEESPAFQKEFLAKTNRYAIYDQFLGATKHL